jgi:corrinoid protein of di/trimethylamine methyltransferase
MSKQSEIEAVASAVFSGDKQAARAHAEIAIKQGIPALQILHEGLEAAILSIGESWRKQEIFLPEVLMAVEAWNFAMEVVEPHLSAENKAEATRGVVVIGTVKGDIHEIGKNIVATILKTAGFEVHDIGTDLAASVFVSEAEKYEADIIASSALMTTTMPHQRDIVEYLETNGKRASFLYMVGGAPVSQEWATQIGADAYGKNAEDAVRLALALVESKKHKLES